MLFAILVVTHILVSFSLILVVLMQSSKGEGLAGSAFGGGGVSGAVFGGRGAASFLSKATSVLAVLFMLNSGALALISSGGPTGSNAGGQPGESVVTRQARQEREQALQQQQQQTTFSDSLQITPIEIKTTTSDQPSDTSGN
ncbi:MAG: preprotein translocase subunit SecG [candidate division Zixibacteria bacterium]|nr:preprotein translocase subunit SecG [candidate division Zixibacteria bacterium]